MGSLTLSTRSGPANAPGRSLLNLLAALCVAGAVMLMGQSLWILAKAELAQLLLDRAFSQSLASGKPVKPWAWADTWPEARIEVPRLGAEAIVLHGATPESLAFGPAHLSDTPDPGEAGTPVIAAHRDTHFRFLKEVVQGDVIRVTRRDGLAFDYRVVASRVAEWNATGIDRHAPGHRLVLSTCWPFDAITHGGQRYIVEAVME